MHLETQLMKKNKILNDQWPLNGKPINPMRRKPISETLDVGIKVNTCLSTKRPKVRIIAARELANHLIGMMTKFTNADVVVVALIGKEEESLVILFRYTK